MKYGTAYYPDYLPESEWSQDLDRMVSCGVTSVRILEFGWCFYEPTPGVFVWDGVDRFLDLCLARKLAVCLATPTATPPPWFFQQFPDAQLLDRDARLSQSLGFEKTIMSLDSFFVSGNDSCPSSVFFNHHHPDFSIWCKAWRFHLLYVSIKGS